MSAKRPSGNSAERQRNWVAQFINEPILEGQRDESLTKIAGYLRHYHPPDVVETLLKAINEARCQPPVPDAQVQKIARSIDQAEGRNHDGPLIGVPIAPMEEAE